MGNPILSLSQSHIGFQVQMENTALSTQGAKVNYWQEVTLAGTKREVILCMRRFPDFSACSNANRSSELPVFDQNTVCAIGNLFVLGKISNAIIEFRDNPEVGYWNKPIWSFEEFDSNLKPLNLNTSKGRNVLISSSAFGSKANFTANFNFSVRNSDNKLGIFSFDRIFAKKIDISAFISAENPNATLYLGTNNKREN